MRWTGWMALAAAALALGGCVYGYGSMVQANYSRSSRPHASYYCYDCHGYRFFDPYYDYCVGNGFRYRWSEHPRVIALYRERYVRIRQNHPDYGRYRYAPDYRSSSRYREGKRYENGRSDRDDRKGRRRGADREETRERRRDPPGKKEDSREPRAPRGGRRFATLAGGGS